LRDPLPPSVRVLKARQHGAFHLRQVLFAKDDAYILDFAGEPRQSLAERRRKGPAGRDVAGLVRSIDYAATAALQRALETWPHERDRLLAALQRWSEHSVAAFMASYREALTNPLLWPTDAAEADYLLDFFLMEKVFTEIDDDLANRPSWLHVPLMGLQRILSHKGWT